MMNAIRNAFALLSVNDTQLIAQRSASVFMKPQKKMDPEVAKIREARKRRRLEKEIREIKKHSKKCKPVEEMTIDIISAKNIEERHRPPIAITEEVEDVRALIYKEYNRSRKVLELRDQRWLRVAMARQDSALAALRAIRPELYEAAVSVNDDTFYSAAIVLKGPPLTPPLEDYVCPDGEYVDTTRKWT